MMMMLRLKSFSLFADGGFACVSWDTCYFPKARKSWFVVKQEHLPKAQKLFADQGVQITSAGRRYLGGAIGCPDFDQGYLEGLIEEWIEHLE